MLFIYLFIIIIIFNFPLTAFNGLVEDINCLLLKDEQFNFLCFPLLIFFESETFPIREFMYHHGPGVLDRCALWGDVYVSARSGLGSSISGTSEKGQEGYLGGGEW